MASVKNQRSVGTPHTRARPRLVLASSSSYRRMLLERLRLPFVTIASPIDESPRPGEAPSALVARLAQAKATAVEPLCPDALIIGSDQVAVCEGMILGKPHDEQAAIAQLTRQSGRRVDFITGLALLDAATGALRVDCIPYSVYFRELTPEQIVGYVEAERPLDCAGSFKSEGLGIALLRRMEGDDPTALIGLPLIGLAQMLRDAGMDVPSRGAGLRRETSL